MKINIFEYNKSKIAEVFSDTILINNTQDALDIMADCSYQGAEKIILHENNINPDFFELKSGMAGEILQKFSNYRISLAIIGSFSKYSSKSLRDFIFESNKAKKINFVGSLEEAKKALTN